MCYCCVVGCCGDYGEGESYHLFRSYCNIWSQMGRFCLIWALARGGSVHLLSRHLVGSTEGEGEALALEGTLDATGEDEEEEAEDEDNVGVPDRPLGGLGVGDNLLVARHHQATCDWGGGGEETSTPSLSLSSSISSSTVAVAATSLVMLYSAAVAYSSPLMVSSSSASCLGSSY